MAHNYSDQAVYSTKADNVMAAILNADLWHLKIHGLNGDMLPHNICGLPVHAIAMLKLAETYQNINSSASNNTPLFLDMPLPLTMQTLVTQDVLEASCGWQNTSFAYNQPMPVNVNAYHLAQLKKLCGKFGLDMAIGQPHTHVVFSQAPNTAPFALLAQFKNAAQEAVKNPMAAFSCQTICQAYDDNITRPQEQKLWLAQAAMLEEDGHKIYTGEAELDCADAAIRYLVHIYA